MNLQIFGTKKNADSRKAERYFKERGIRFQFIDMKEKGLSRGELQSVCQAVGGYEKLLDPDCKQKDLLALITYISESSRMDKILENQGTEASDCSERQAGHRGISARGLEVMGESLNNENKTG